MNLPLWVQLSKFTKEELSDYLPNGIPFKTFFYEKTLENYNVKRHFENITDYYHGYYPLSEITNFMDETFFSKYYE